MKATEENNIIVNETLSENEPSSFSLVSALGIAGLLSGIILVGTFLYTNPLIQNNKEAAIQRAIYKVLPNCDSYIPLIMVENKLLEKVENANGKEESDKSELLIYAGYNANKELIGFAVPGSEPGFQDIIETMFGYDDMKRMIIGFEVLQSKETPGLGDKIFKDADFQTNFLELAIEPEIVPVKKGAKTKPNEVEAITGATISSKAIARLLNKTISIWKDPIDEFIRSNNLRISKNIN